MSVILLSTAYISGLIWCGVSDLKTQMIPDLAVIILLSVSLIRAVNQGHLVSSLIAAAIVFLAGCLLFSLGGMGGGDVKLMTALAAWFYIPRAFCVLLWATIAGIIWGLIRMAKLGILKNWAAEFRAALANAVILRSLSALAWDRLPEDDNVPSPPKAIPFGTCLAAVAAICVLLG